MWEFAIFSVSNFYEKLIQRIQKFINLTGRTQKKLHKGFENFYQSLKLCWLCENFLLHHKITMINCSQKIIIQLSCWAREKETERAYEKLSESELQKFVSLHCFNSTPHNHSLIYKISIHQSVFFVFFFFNPFLVSF